MAFGDCVELKSIVLVFSVRRHTSQQEMGHDLIDRVVRSELALTHRKPPATVTAQKSQVASA